MMPRVRHEVRAEYGEPVNSSNEVVSEVIRTPRRPSLVERIAHQLWIERLTLKWANV